MPIRAMLIKNFRKRAQRQEAERMSETIMLTVFLKHDQSQDAERKANG